MKILAKYVKDKYIDIFIEGVTPSDTQWEGVKAMLKEAKFTLDGFAYRRTFDNPTEFSKWLNHTSALTTKFGGTQPVEVQDPLQNLLDMIAEFETRFNQMNQEVSALKKFDAIAQQKLSDLKKQLENK
jgi:hypothetical protein